ncbi:MAG TPA: hypothetical protein VF712_13870 [Thermoleophilaceae bacterium]|jgi:hypothetical protein
MPSATVQDETISDVPGVRFTTDARPGSPEERQLQEIQSRLAEGETSLPGGTTLPHLNLYMAQTVNGPSQSFISLWVPKEQQSQAVELLESAGFRVS